MLVKGKVPVAEYAVPLLAATAAVPFKWFSSSFAIILDFYTAYVVFFSVWQFSGCLFIYLCIHSFIHSFVCLFVYFSNS